MDTLIEYLFSPIPLWGAVISFLFGGFLGWLARVVVEGFISSPFKKIFSYVIQVTVVILWSAATARAVFVDGVAYPPLFLNLFFGAIVGSLNEGIGQYLLSAIKTIKNVK